MGGETMKRCPAAGYMLLEVLVSLVIFSIGVLGVVAMQANAIRADSAAQYRTDANMLANELIGRMWADNRAPASLQAAYQGSGGSGGTQYTAWVAEISGTNGINLPRVAEVPPTVTVVAIDGNIPPATAKSLVTVTLYWLMPGDAVANRHSHVVIAEINQ